MGPSDQDSGRLGHATGPLSRGLYIVESEICVLLTAMKRGIYYLSLIKGEPLSKRQSPLSAKKM